VKNEIPRREVLGMGIGAVALATSGAAFSAAQTGKETDPGKVNNSSDLSTFNKYGEELETIFLLRSSPIAVKMLEKETDIPKGAFRPKRDGGYHLAQCQAFGMSRREGKTVAMLKEDHWCPTALMAYGFVNQPASVTQWTHPYDRFEEGKYVGIVTAPLKKANFIPDVVIVYSNSTQLRALLLTMPISDVPLVSGHFFPPSCGWSVVAPMKTKQFYIVMPDPGEYQRALTEEGDMIFSIPREKMPTMMANVRKNEHGPFSYRDHNMFMHPDFEQPQFYKDMFKAWGLDSE